MIEFIQFDDRNKEHRELAMTNQEIIFEGYDGILRFGWMNVEYNVDSISKYVFVSNGKSYKADCNYFALIKKL